jgi:hypothetical protein
VGDSDLTLPIFWRVEERILTSFQLKPGTSVPWGPLLKLSNLFVVRRISTGKEPGN